VFAHFSNVVSSGYSAHTENINIVHIQKCYENMALSEHPKIDRLNITLYVLILQMSGSLL